MAVGSEVRQKSTPVIIAHRGDKIYETPMRSA